jgi:hypothetical protein
MKTRKISIKWFVDFDKEEKWLNDMAREGWAFWHSNGLVYRFKQCKPGEFIYQIDFDEDKSKQGVGDYVVFRKSCGDQFVHQWKRKIYWKRETASGPFEAENNVAAKLHLTNKAFNFHLNNLLGLTFIAAIAFLVLRTVGTHLPPSAFAEWLTDVSTGLTFGIFVAELVILLPILKKLQKKINELVDQIF